MCHQGPDLNFEEWFLSVQVKYHHKKNGEGAWQMFPFPPFYAATVFYPGILSLCKVLDDQYGRRSIKESKQNNIKRLCLAFGLGVYKAIGDHCRKAVKFAEWIPNDRYGKSHYE